MKVAVSSRGRDLASSVSRRFGKAPWFLLVDTVSGGVEVCDNRENLFRDFGAGGKTAEALLERGAEAVITGRICPEALKLLESSGAGVYLVDSGTVGALVDSLKRGDLLPSTR